MKTPEEVVARMENYMPKEDIEKGIQNTDEISKTISEYNIFQDVKVFELDIEEPVIKHLMAEWYDECPYLKKYVYSIYKQDRFLIQQLEIGFKKTKQKIEDITVKRIEEELENLWCISEVLKQRLSAYYVSTQELVNLLWEYGTIVGAGRGSTCAFYISYLLEISQVNPLKYNLPSWRHIHKTKVELSDIDLDILPSMKDGFITFLKKKWGEDRVLHISTFKSEGTKSAILTSARGLGINDDLAHEIADMVKAERGKLWTIEDCIHGNEDKGRKPDKIFVKKMQEFPYLLDTIQEIEGLICGRSIHASGVIVFNQHFLEQNSLMKAPNGVLITAWDMKDSESTGCLN